MVLGDGKGLRRGGGLDRVSPAHLGLLPEREGVAHMMLLPSEGVLCPIDSVAFHNGVCSIVSALGLILVHPHGVLGLVETLLLGSVRILFGHDRLLTRQLAPLQNVPSLLLRHAFHTLL